MREKSQRADTHDPQLTSPLSEQDLRQDLGYLWRPPIHRAPDS